MIWTKNTWKKIWKSWWKIKSSKPWLQEIWSKFFDLMHSIQKPEYNPNANTRTAAQEGHSQTWKNCQKSQFWNHLYRLIQSTILVPLASLEITDHIPIKNLHQSSRNRYTELQIFHEKLIIVFSNLSIFIAFYSLIHVPYKILKLTNILNCLFMCCMQICHVWVLGFAEF